MAKKNAITPVIVSNEMIFDDLCNAILKCINNFCTQLKKGSKKVCVTEFQNAIMEELNNTSSQKNWITEYEKPNAAEKDKIDIYCASKACNWIIEIDTTRADQAGKKAFSRFALYGAGYGVTPFFYVALIYPGTKAMNTNEVIKYSRYGHSIAKKMNNKNEFRTIFIDCENSRIKVLRFDKQPSFSVNRGGNYSMREAVKKAVEVYLSKKGNSYKKLEKALNSFNGNHNGQQSIVSSSPQAKDPYVLNDNKNNKFYLTKEWMYSGNKANFDEIVKFFKERKILIQQTLEIR